MGFGSTVNFVSGRLVGCYSMTCEFYQNGSWQHLQNTMEYRRYHSSVTTEDAVLLIGGSGTKTTELIPVNGSAARQGPITVRHGEGHCTIKVSADMIVVTGGTGSTRELVTEYRLTDGTETHLTSMGTPREEHGCGVYLNADNQQVLLVTGGMDKKYRTLSSTEVAVYTGAGNLQWKSSSQLPSPRRRIRVGMVNNVIHVTAGYYSYYGNGDDRDNLNSILSWDSVSESWKAVGELKIGRAGPAAIAIPSSIIECPAA